MYGGEPKFIAKEEIGAHEEESLTDSNDKSKVHNFKESNEAMKHPTSEYIPFYAREAKSSEGNHSPRNTTSYKEKPEERKIDPKDVNWDYKQHSPPHFPSKLRNQKLDRQ